MGVFDGSVDKDDDLGCAKHLLHLSFWSQCFALLWHHRVKFVAFDQFSHHVDAAHEFLVNEHLWEGRPFRVHFQPLSDPLVSQNIEGLILVLAKEADQASRELAFGLLFGALDENEERVARKMTLDVTEDLFLFGFKPLGVEFVLVVDERREILGLETFYLYNFLARTVGVQTHHCLDSLHIKNFDKLRLIAVNIGKRKPIVAFWHFFHHVFKLLTCFIPGGPKKYQNRSIGTFFLKSFQLIFGVQLLEDFLMSSGG